MKKILILLWMIVLLVIALYFSLIDNVELSTHFIVLSILWKEIFLNEKKHC